MTVTLTATDSWFSDVPNDLLAPYYTPFASATGVLGAANRAVISRVIAKKSGFLRDLTIVPSVQSGNIDIGIYDTGDTTTTVRTKLWSSGSIACPAALALPIVVTADPGAGVVPIVAGRQYDLALAADNNTAAFYRSAATISWLPAAFQTVPGAALPKLGALAATSFPLPATIAEATLTQLQIVYYIIGRISAT